ncbi:uncharacterized protein LOC131670741 [Phymastichus coffea]|uniref:uncharacterized protein LOC131670741 n=1 Tax=Phymastichus coffea TaxID=108790 RepID=UPI00273BF3E1|nr:uncharacterized protein LOC131670741 [Phymastichus coffea]XP_058802593.1 uncharacterized protein LOC131670741 [Phymastichus coffea]
MEDEHQRYRREQEEAVSNKSGSSASEVIFVIFPNICSLLLTLTLTTLLGPQTSRQSKIILEFCFVILPSILCCTVLHTKVIEVSLIFLIISTANILSILAWRHRDAFKTQSTHSISKLAFITNFRALTNIITVICILAVDFTCFPRKFVKTETYGYSLMDTGVGLFMIANALVAPEARRIDSDLKISFFAGLTRTFKDCLPLLVLGMGRYLAVEFLGYQKHVTEYGVHWNFFLTLACVKLFTGLLSKNLNSRYSFVTGLWILVMHEYGLSTQGLKEWVMSDEPRNNFISANREGWVSIPGYVGLYLLGIALGRLIHTTYQNNDNELVFEITPNCRIGYTKLMLLALKLYFVASVCYCVTYYCEQYFGISRRLANSGYCVWILTLSSLLLTFLVVIEIFLEIITGCLKEKSRRKISKHLRRDDLNSKSNISIVKTLEIFEAVNNNGLLFFIFANLLTGAINMSIKTLRQEEPRAVMIMLAYMAVNFTFVLLRQKAKYLLHAKKNN